MQDIPIAKFASSDASEKLLILEAAVARFFRLPPGAPGVGDVLFRPAWGRVSGRNIEAGLSSAASKRDTLGAPFEADMSVGGRGSMSR